MADFEELIFVIPGYTPDTLPLGRLIEYLKELSAVLGDPQDLHLIAVKEGSAAPTFRAPAAVALEAKDKAAKVQRGDGTKKQVDAYNRIRRMLRRDTKEAGVAKPAVFRSSQRTVLEIPAAPADDGLLSGIRQFTTIDGKLIRAGGAGDGDDATLQMQDLEGKVISGLTAKRSLTKELGGMLWEPLRLSGVGTWGRNSNAGWYLERMHVQSYEKLDDEGLSLTVEKLRSLKVNWPKNADSVLLKEREDN